jgi:dTDP-4-dehydrorhamnose 3,5-epimerase
MKTKKCNLEGILIIEPTVFEDDRGFFLETFHSERYKALGIKEDFVQDNHSRSKKNVIRGLHFTKNNPQSQILTVIRGKIFDVVVDIRNKSPTFGKWFGIELSDTGARQIYMPHGFAHGFCVLSETADLHYKVSAKYNAGDDAGLRWNDPVIRINWPIDNAIVSTKDQQLPFFNNLDA